MTRKLSAIGLIAAWLVATSAWAQSPKVVLVQGRALVDVESLSDEFGNRVMPIEPDESPTEAMNKATVNTAAINRYLSKFGSSTGETRGLYLNGRLYAINDTLIEGAAAWVGWGGIILDGGGGRSNYVPNLGMIRFDAATETGQEIQSLGGFVWVGNPNNSNLPYTDRPMIELSRGFGSTIENCCFWGWAKAGQKPRQPTRISEMAEAAIELGHTVAGVPSGKHAFHNLNFVFCQAAYRITGDTHADNYAMSGFQCSYGCPYVLRAPLANSQAFGFGGGAYWLVSGPFDPVRVCSFNRGGKVHFDSLKMLAIGTIFEHIAGSTLESDFSCDRIWWDTNALWSDGEIQPHIAFENDAGANDNFPYTASATAGSTTLTLGGGLTAKAEDVGLLLIITGGIGGWVLNDDQAPYVVQGASDGGSTWTLDRAPAPGTNGTAMVGYAGPRAINRLVDMIGTSAYAPIYADISGHLGLDGDGQGGENVLANMVRLKDSTDFKPSRVQLNVMNLHRATARCYGKTQVARKANPFVVPSSCKLFVDVNEAWENDSSTNDTLSYEPASPPPHGMFNADLIHINDLSPAANHLGRFDTSSEPQFYNWAMIGKPAIVGASGKGLRTLVFDGMSPAAQTSGTAASATIEITGYTVHSDDVGKTLIITGGDNFLPDTYTVESVDEVANTWTLDTECTDGTGAGADMEGRVDHGLAGISNLSVGGVIRLDAGVPDTTPDREYTIAGVWDEGANQRCWRVYLDESERLNLQLSTDGTIPFNFQMTSRAIELNRNTFWYATRNGTTGDVNLYVDDTKQTFVAGQTGATHSSTAPLCMGCAASNGSIVTNDTFVGATAIVMIDDDALSDAVIAYRAEEFTARRGTYLNTELAQ